MALFLAKGGNTKAILNRLKLNKKAETFLEKAANTLERIPLFNKIFRRMCESLYITTKPGEDVRIKVTLLVFAYLAGILLIVFFTRSYASVWYLYGLNILLGALISYIAINMYITRLINRAIRQLPQAIDALEAAYFKTNRLDRAIEISLDYMPKDIAIGFRVLYFNMLRNRERAIQEFKKAYNHPYIDILASLFSVYIRKGGDIGTQLQYLNSIVQSDLVIKNFSRASMIKHKVLAGATVLAVPFMVFLNSKLSPNVESFFRSTLEGSTSIAMAIAATVVYFIFVEILEHI